MSSSAIERTCHEQKDSKIWRAPAAPGGRVRGAGVRCFSFGGALGADGGRMRWPWVGGGGERYGYFL